VCEHGRAKVVAVCWTEGESMHAVLLTCAVSCAQLLCQKRQSLFQLVHLVRQGKQSVRHVYQALMCVALSI
jgi:hypothetical protein